MIIPSESEVTQNKTSAMSSLPIYMAIGLGSALGGSARWLSSELMYVLFGAGFPWGTLLVNVIGSFLIGFYATRFVLAGSKAPSQMQQHFVISGICGGYTTFSIFSLETVQLLDAGLLQAAGLNIVGSLVLWMLAVWAGYLLANRTAGA